MFARTWAGLLQEATSSKSESSWVEFFMFPKAVLLSPPRGVRGVSRKASLAEVVLGRIQRWSSDRHGLWNEAKERSAKRPAHKPTACRKKDVEVSALAALRIGDVKKALQVLNAAPFAPKDESTLIALRKLHPKASPRHRLRSSELLFSPTSVSRRRCALLVLARQQVYLGTSPSSSSSVCARSPSAF